MLRVFSLALLRKQQKKIEYTHLRSYWPLVLAPVCCCCRTKYYLLLCCFAAGRFVVVADIRLAHTNILI